MRRCATLATFLVACLLLIGSPTVHAELHLPSQVSIRRAGWTAPLTHLGAPAGITSHPKSGLKVHWPSGMCFVDQTDMVIDKVEGFLKSVKSLARENGKVLTAAGGCMMLLYGGQFTNSVLLLQAFRTGGWSEMQKGFSELQQTYSRSRQAMREEMPTLMKAREMLPKLKQEAQESLQLLREANKEIEKARADQQNAIKQLKTSAAALAKFERKSHDTALPDIREVKRKLETAQAEASALCSSVAKRMEKEKSLLKRAQERQESAQKLYSESLRVASSVGILVDAVDPDHVKGVFQGMGAGILACVAAAKAPLAGGAVVGTDVGKMASKRIVPVLEEGLERSNVPLDAKARKWLETGVSAGTTAGALWAAVSLRRVLLTCSAAAIGARLLTESSEHLLTSIALPDLDLSALSRIVGGTIDLEPPPAMREAQRILASMPGLDDNLFGPDAASPRARRSAMSHAIETALAASGIALQLWPGRQPLAMPGPVAAVLAPALALEAWLGAQTVAGVVAAAK